MYEGNNLILREGGGRVSPDQSSPDGTLHLERNVMHMELITGSVEDEAETMRQKKEITLMMSCN